MIFIQLNFPTGHWHATAWGTHVNEGIPEWPPCPWRLCRALMATWFWKFRRDEPVLRSLIAKLASTPPDFLLPEASSAHTRHYMPVNEGPKEVRVKIFDTFVYVPSDRSLWIRWNVSLDPTEESLLKTLLHSLNYLGRAESLVTATFCHTYPSMGLGRESEWTCPSERSQLMNSEPIRLLAPREEPGYQAWIAEQNAVKETGKRKRNAAPSLPGCLFEALLLDTADWKKQGWNLPPGARWIEYLRPRDAFKISAVGHSAPGLAKRPRVARFALVSKVPPSITQALSLSERFHQTLCKLVDGDHSILSGHTDDGKPLQGHSHVFYLPECDAHGYITHMSLHAPGGFDETACRALGRLRKVWGAEGFDVEMILLATGQPEDFAAVPFFRPAKVWRSLTPFVPVRHPKATRTGVPKIDPDRNLQIGSPEHDCWRLIDLMASDRRVLSVRQYQRGNRILVGLRSIPCLHFQRKRRTGHGLRASERGYSLEIEFDHPVTLPFGLGYGAHFGLGLFMPDKAR